MENGTMSLGDLLKQRLAEYDLPGDPSKPQAGDYVVNGFDEPKMKIPEGMYFSPNDAPPPSGVDTYCLTKVQAIVAIRCLIDCSLKDAKDFLDANMNSYRTNNPNDIGMQSLLRFLRKAILADVHLTHPNHPMSSKRY